MSVRAEQQHADTYLNPVYPHSFPDPFVLRYGGHYFAYATGHAKDGNIFDVLTSTDLVKWSYVGAAMQPLDDPAPFYWAPEVALIDGRFYLYYSVGNETLMHLRVAVSDRPDGGFIDSGIRLTHEDFAIDAHVFTDEDGERYLFYATDFLEHSHIGTGTVVDRMVDPFTIEGKPRPVTRAKYDWQVYDPQRKEKGGVRWHTVEGPSVIKHKGRYYEMYSGGNWQNTSYGVSFAVTDDIHSRDEWLQHSDGETVLPLLRTVPGKIVGPGHNCIVTGPNGRELYCVYHRWTEAGRVMAIDRMDFAGDRMFIMGATDSPQPAPYLPTSSGFDHGWRTTGEWRIDQDLASSTSPGRSTLTRAVPSEFSAEFNVEVQAEALGNVGLQFGSPVNDRAIELTTASGEPLRGKHSIRLELDGRWMKIIADGWQTVASGWLETPVREVSLFSKSGPASFSDFRLTAGFEDLFDRGDETPDNWAWTTSGGSARLTGNGELILKAGDETAVLSRETGYKDIDLAVNIRSTDENGEFSIALRDRSGCDQIALHIGDTITVSTPREEQTHELPTQSGTMTMRQYRMVVRSGRALAYLEDRLLGEFHVSPAILIPVIRARRSPVAMDMVRVTAI